MTKILFVYKHNSSFIHTDIALLKKHYEVIPFYFSFHKIPALRRALKRCDIVFIWFASYHAYITAKLTNKPIVVVTGGYDVAGERSFNYGLMLHHRRMVGYILNKATAVLAVSEFNRYDTRAYFRNINPKVVYNCADSTVFKPAGKKEDIVLTVGYVNKESWIRKGIDNFVELAIDFTGEPTKFIVVGKIDKKLQKQVSAIQREIPNLQFTGFLSNDKLLQMYQKAKVYCQLSLHEAFGVSVAEAMLCECTPVVSFKAALPEVVGDAGFFVSDIRNSSYKLTKAALSIDKGPRARQRVIDLFSPEKREKQLVAIIEGIIPKLFK